MTQAHDQPTTPAALLAERLRADSASPLVTFYDDGTGERVELSSATFANWVAKTANLLRDDLGVTPDLAASVRLPPHWQTFVVIHAVWALGGAVHTGASAAEPRFDVAFVTTDAHDSAPDADDVVALGLRPMGMPGDELAGSIVDYDREVRLHGDHFQGPRIDADSAAFYGPGEIAMTHADLVAKATMRTRHAESETGMTRFAWDTDALDLSHDVDAVLHALINGGGIVLSTPHGSVARCATERAAAWPSA